MTGETNLAVLLATMQPILYPEEYVFCSMNCDRKDDLDLDPIGYFQESEGRTMILNRDRADAAGLTYSATFHLITLTVHSSLEAIGFLAAITAKLAEHQISVNAISAYYHDHLFAPVDRSQEAMQLLQSLARSASSLG